MGGHAPGWNHAGGREIQDKLFFSRRKGRCRWCHLAILPKNKLYNTEVTKIKMLYVYRLHPENNLFILSYEQESGVRKADALLHGMNQIAD